MHYGIRGTAFEWIKSYLTNRIQRTKTNYTSNSSKIAAGVPQGSILGPTLFILFINDLFQLVNDNTSLLLYADDTAVVLSALSADLLQSNVNTFLHLYLQWCSNNGILLNPAKTEYMLFNCDNIVFDIMGLHLNSASAVKYLGLYVDKNLLWKFHVDKVLVKCSQIVGLIKKIVPMVPSCLYKMLYNSLLRSTFSYLLMFWFGNDRSGRWKLINMVDCLLKKLAHYSHLSLKDFVLKYDLLDVLSTYKLQCLLCSYDLMHNIISEPNVHLFLNDSIHGHSTRRALDIHQMHVSSGDMHNFIHNCIINWNACDPDIRNLSRNNFILVVKRQLIKLQVDAY